MVMNLIDTSTHELKTAWRNLRSHAGFSALAIVTLALGIGASVAIWSVVDGVLLRPLSFENAESLVRLYRFDPRESAAGSPEHEQPLSKPGFLDLMSESKHLESGFGFMPSHMTVGKNEDNVRVEPAALVTGPVLETLGVSPAFGRDLRTDEATEFGAKSALISWSLFQSMFAGDVSALGKPLTIDGTAYTIVGIAPQGLDFPGKANLFVPHQWPLEDCGRDCHFMASIARLAAGSTVLQANEELAVLGGRLAAAYPSSEFKRYRADDLRAFQTWEVRPAMMVLMAAVILVLVIACANVANLLLVRGEKRSRELSVRVALGASRARLLTQLLLENALLALFGGALGLLLARFALEVLLAVAPDDLPRVENIGLDARAVLFAAAAGLSTLLLFGLLPALRSARQSLTSKLGSRGNSGTGERFALLTAEVAISLVLLLGAGLLLRSLNQQLSVDLGFQKDRVTTFLVDLPDAFDNEHERTIGVFEQFEQALRSQPGVESVGAAFSVPLGPVSIGGSFHRADRETPSEAEEPKAAFNAVTAGYFETLGVAIQRGRNFSSQDRLDTQPVAIINQRLADQYYPGEDPIGKQLVPHMSLNHEFDEPYTIIGMINDMRTAGPTRAPVPQIYGSQRQSASDLMGLVVRSSGNLNVGQVAQAELKKIVSGVPIQNLSPLSELVRKQTASTRFFLSVLAAFAFLALGLAAVGLYGVVAYTVAQRTPRARRAHGAGRRPWPRHAPRVARRFAAHSPGCGARARLWGAAHPHAPLTALRRRAHGSHDLRRVGTRSGYCCASRLRDPSKTSSADRTDRGSQERIAAASPHRPQGPVPRSPRVVRGPLYLPTTRLPAPCLTFALWRASVPPSTTVSWNSTKLPASAKIPPTPTISLPEISIRLRTRAATATPSVDSMRELMILTTHPPFASMAVPLTRMSWFSMVMRS